MTAPTNSDPRIIDGAAVARSILHTVTGRAQQFETSTGRKPCLAAVLVGDDPASITYVAMKQRRSAKHGIDSRVTRLEATSTTAQLVEAITALSEDPSVDGILLQHPVPSHIDERAAFEAITPQKDVDGVTMHSFAAMAFGLPTLASATPAGILRLLDAYEVDLSGLHAVIVGRSPILGKPAGMLLLARHATVTYCHSRTRQLPDLVRSADLVVAAVGIPKFIQGPWIKRLFGI